MSGSPGETVMSRTRLINRTLPWFLGTVSLGSVAIALWYFRDAALRGGSGDFSWLVIAGIGVVAAGCGLQGALLYSGRHAVALAIASIGIGWATEAAGVRWGSALGIPYSYGQPAGPLLPGRVPVIVPLVWFGLSHFVLMVRSHRFGFAPPRRWIDILRLAAWSGYGLAVLDLLIEPVATSLGAWRWTAGGPYYGIPLFNYLWWMVVGALIFAGFGVLCRGIPLRPLIIDPGGHARNAVRWGCLLLAPVAGMAFYLGRGGAVAAFLVAGIPVLWKPFPSSLARRIMPG